MLRLTSLAPDIIEAVLRGEEPDGLSLEKLRKNLPVRWTQLGHEKHRLRDALSAKIDTYRSEARKAGFQRSLFGDDAVEIEVSPELCFEFDSDRYAPNWYYGGSYQWQKHFYPTVGELKDDGEEFQCAQFIDQMDEVKHWVRNLERRPDTSFWLQTSTDRFYPDFVAELTDGRILVVEYKGEDR